MSQQIDSIITKIAEHAAPALAAYTSLSPDMKKEDIVKNLIDQKMIETQAEAFANTYEVIEQFNGAFGGSVTIFENKITGQRSLSARGTQPLDLRDLGGDIVVGVGVLPSWVNPQYMEISAKVEEWINKGKLTKFEVDGHSVGGYFVVNLKKQYPENITHVYAYNTPGEYGVLGTILTLLGVSTTPDPGITIIGTAGGLSLIAGSGMPAGAITIEVKTENDLSHGQDNLLNGLQAVAMRVPGSGVTIKEKIRAGTTLTSNLEILPEGQTNFSATVATRQNNHDLVVQYREQNGKLVADRVISIDGQAPEDDTAYIASLNQQEISPSDLANNTPGAKALTEIDANGVSHVLTPAETLKALNPTEANTLADLTAGLATMTDILSLVKAIQTGQPLPIVASGLRVAVDYQKLTNHGNVDINLAAASDIAGGILSLMSLNDALKRNDALGVVTSTANLVNFTNLALLRLGKDLSSPALNAFLNGGRAAATTSDTAARWEVDTAIIQDAMGMAKAGLAEEEWAAKAGFLAPALDPQATSQVFLPITLDLDGSGRIERGNEVWRDGNEYSKIAWRMAA